MENQIQRKPYLYSTSNPCNKLYFNAFLDSPRALHRTGYNAATQEDTITEHCSRNSRITKLFRTSSLLPLSLPTSFETSWPQPPPPPSSPFPRCPYIHRSWTFMTRIYSHCPHFFFSWWTPLPHTSSCLAICRKQTIKMSMWGGSRGRTLVKKQPRIVIYIYVSM